MGIPILGDVISAVKDIVSEVVVDKDKKNDILARIDERYHQEMMGQIEVNKVEAAHGSIFVAGWRPAIGWGCGLALVYNTLVAPAFNLGVTDLGFLQTVLLGMLGIGGMRTYEKVKGVATATAALPSSIIRPKGPPRGPRDLLPENAPWTK